MTDVAAFDFDGTLTNGGSVFDFLEPRSRAGPGGTDLRPARPPARPCGPGRRRRWPTGPRSELFIAGAGRHRGRRTSTEVGAEFAAGHLAAHVRPEVRRRLDWHRGRGDRVVVVSASPDAYIRVAAERLGRRRRRSPPSSRSTTRGRLTGRYEGGNCRGEEKIRRLRLWMADDRPRGRTACGPTATAGATCACCGRPTPASTWAGSGRLGRLRGYPGTPRHRSPPSSTV